MRPKSSRPNEVASVLKRLGFIKEPSGATSHMVYRHPDGRKTTIAMHPGDVPTGTLRKIIAQAGLTVEEFNRLV